MRLQEVLKEREMEIGMLETSLKELKDPRAAVGVKKSLIGEDINEVDEEEVEGEAVAVNGKSRPTSDGKLSPTMMNRFAKLRRSLIIEHPPKFADDDDDEDAEKPVESETLDRLDELMR